jgi:outer membrane lipoprotein carrier protein
VSVVHSTHTLMSRVQFLLAMAVVLTLPLSGVAQSPRSAEDVARELQERYDKVRDFAADFTHTYEGGILKKTATERGTLQVKKPGRMRWEYTSPELKLFVSDGSKIYSYVPADKQVIVSSMPEDNSATTAVLFLVGKGNLTRDFSVSYGNGGTDDTYALRLEPRQRQRDYDWLVLVIDRRTMQIRTLVAAEREGGRSTFQFSNYRENIGLPDKIFVFKIPRGADVINADSSGR